jgi:choline-sulfatase
MARRTAKGSKAWPLTPPCTRDISRLLSRVHCPDHLPVRLVSLLLAGSAALAPIACSEGLLQGAEPARPGDSKQPAAVSLAGHRTSFDLITNRAHGLEYHTDRLVIDAGGVAFPKYVDGGWKTSWILGARDEGRPVALVSGLSSLLFIPLDSDGDGPAPGAADLMLTLTLRSRVPNQRLSVFVNEKPAGTMDVASTWGEYPLALPAGLLQPGDNRIRLTFRAAAPAPGGRRSAAALARVVLGRAPEGSPPVPEQSALADDEQALGGLAKRAFALPAAGRLSFFVQVPTAAKLALAFGARAPGATVAVRLARDGAATRTLFEGPAAEGRFTEAAWDLAAEAGRAVRIDLVGRGGATTWGNPRLVVASAPPAPLPEKRFSHIFIWMVDTLRADKVRVYNPKTRVETPHYDAFATDATRFAWAHVPGTWSLPSHASILTGVYPTTHKATAHEARLSKDVPFLAEILKGGGYRTALFSSNGYVSGKWGFDRGWDEIRNFIRESLPNGADYLWKTAAKWMDAPANDGKPQFLYLATIEPHVIYNPKKEFLARYWQKPYRGPIRPNISGVQLGHIKSGKLKINATDKAYLEALHDAEITQSDSLFGAFIADLKQRGIYDTSVVVVVSDHGDEFWEHGDVGHAQGVYQELVHIPLIVRAPGLLPLGKVIEADVEAMDLFPTLLDVAGMATPKSTQGSSLLPLVQDEVAHSPRVALSQNLGYTRGLKVARYRFIHNGPDRMELYDEYQDPLEQKNLAASDPIAFRALRNVFGLLYAFEDRWRKRAWGTAANLNDVFYSEVTGR